MKEKTKSIEHQLNFLFEKIRLIKKNDWMIGKNKKIQITNIEHEIGNITAGAPGIFF
jgi:hypothetical protein